MRALALVLALTLTTGGIVSATDPAQVAQSTTEFAKKVVLAVKAAKDKTGNLPSTVTVLVDGKPVEVKVQVTALAEGFSISGQPTIESKALCPMTSCNIDANLTGSSGPTLVSLVGTAADGSDVVAFATTGTELSITVSNNDKSYTATTSTSVGDIPASGAGMTVIPQPPAPKATDVKPPAFTLADVEDNTPVVTSDDTTNHDIALHPLQRHGEGSTLASSDPVIPGDLGANGSMSSVGNFSDGASPQQPAVSPEQ